MKTTVDHQAQLLKTDNNNTSNVIKKKKHIWCLIAIAALITTIIIIIAVISSIGNNNINDNNDNSDDDKLSSGSASSSSSNYDALTGNGNVLRTMLTYNQLQGSTSSPSSFVDYSVMSLPSNGAEPDLSFFGTFSISSVPERGFETVDDWYGYGNDAQRRRLPSITADIVSDGSHLIPFIRYNQRTSHQYWEYILSSGRIWKENDDNGWIRAALPFTLTQKNAQCAHNGLFMFLFRNNNGGEISNIWYQITQETCMYFKANYWGLISANYQYESFQNSNIDPMDIQSEYKREFDERIPTKAMEEISNDYPNIDYTAFASSRDGLTAQHITINGLYYNGIHYVGDYPTRSGSFPYPEQLIVPSYSTGKSVFLGLAAMYLEHKYGDVFGTNNILDIDYSGQGSNRWTDVTYDDCIDMTTGNYWSPNYMTDEGLLAVENGFFLPETHSAKYNHATTYYNRRVSPSTRWVYHSSDHYLCTFGLKRFLRSKSSDSSADIHDEIYENVYKKIGCSDVLRETKRTYDSEYQPFGSHGLFFTRDDIVKLTNFLNIDHGRIGLEQILNLHQLRSSLQLTSDKGISIGYADDSQQSNAWYYNNGIWSARKLWTNLQCPVDIPLMRGYGGITVVMFPNNVNYYYFGDNNEKDWLVAAHEINKLNPFC